MKKIVFVLIGILITVFGAYRPAQADEAGLINRVKGWVAAVKAGDDRACRAYVAPPPFIESRRLGRVKVKGGEDVLLFSRTKLLPLNRYQIGKITYLDDGYESEVTLDADVIHQRKPLYLIEENDAAANGSGALDYPARITQRWVLLDGTWFIKSVTIPQYL